MTPLRSLMKHARGMTAGLVSFLLILGLLRWSNGEPLIEPKSDVGILIGVALIALYFVISDANSSKARPIKGHGPELH